MTPADIIYRRRVRAIERAAEVGVTAACREAGVSRKSYYRWCDRASRYGLCAHAQAAASAADAQSHGCPRGGGDLGRGGVAANAGSGSPR
jgi:hypothetical protein